MRIYIDKIEKNIVYFTTNIGSAKGFWKESFAPNKMESFVELDIDEKYSYDEFKVSKVREYKIEIVDGKVQCRLQLIEYDQNGCATFRLADSIIEIETNYDERFFSLINSFVTVLVNKINLYDEHMV